MARSGLGGGGGGSLGPDYDESSDSDHRTKRRKHGNMHQNIQMRDRDPVANMAKTAPAAPSAFAAKMMAKMGYKEGQGLGAMGRGRLAPIETQLRPQGVGLGAVKEKTKQAKEEEKREAAFRGEVIEDSSDEERKRKKEAKEKRKSAGILGGSGPYGQGQAKARPKAKYRTAAEIEESAEGLEIPNVLKTIIDATGSETRVLSSAAGVMSTPNSMVPAETEAMKLSRLAQRESTAFAEEWQALQARREHFEDEQRLLRAQQNAGEAEERLVHDMLDAVKDLRLESSQTKDWEQIISSLDNHLDRLSSMHDPQPLMLQEIAIAAIWTRFKEDCAEWDPLMDPSGPSPHLRRIQKWLDIHPSQPPGMALVDLSIDSRPPRQRKATSYYETMIQNLWLPPIRSAVTAWKTHLPDSMTAIVEAWRSLLPPFILTNFVDQLVAQKLKLAIAEWRPRRSRSDHAKSQAPEQWLFPWLQYLDEGHTNPKHADGVMAETKRRLKSVMSTWDVSHGLFPGLDQWRKAFPLDIPHFLVRYTLPRLAEYFTAHFDVDPADQDLAALTTILTWVPYFSLSTIAQLFADIFFAKWHHILRLWLVGEPDHTEIMQWYQWWKTQLSEMLPAGFNDVPVIADCFEKGLTMINVALDATEHHADVAVALQPLFDEPIVEPAQNHKDNDYENFSPAQPPAVADPTTFRDVVEDWCAENGLLMIALREAEVLSGLPLFRITASANGKGGCIVYLKGDVVWIREATKNKLSESTGPLYTPIGLGQGLLDRAEGK